MVRLDVNEPERKKTMENPGASDWLAKLGGAQAGLPFFAVLSPDGKKLGDSLILPNRQNVGFPGGPEEIAAFDRFLHKVAPKMSAADRDTVSAAFREAAAKLNPH